ncbi:MAG: hypothetical protein HY976_04110 [Candidatus Kerfeldbacteria bacterium]|nr:hypothetical protein [Candidatus Kerfeldbacteria bacterium]
MLHQYVQHKRSGRIGQVIKTAVRWQERAKRKRTYHTVHVPFANHEEHEVRCWRANRTVPSTLEAFCLYARRQGIR